MSQSRLFSGFFQQVLRQGNEGKGLQRSQSRLFSGFFQRKVFSNVYELNSVSRNPVYFQDFFNLYLEITICS